MMTHKIVFSFMLVTPMCVLGSKQCGPRWGASQNGIFRGSHLFTIVIALVAVTYSVR